MILLYSIIPDTPWKYMLVFMLILLFTDFAFKKKYNQKWLYCIVIVVIPLLLYILEMGIIYRIPFKTVEVPLRTAVLILTCYKLWDCNIFKTIACVGGGCAFCTFPSLLAAFCGKFETDSEYIYQSLSIWTIRHYYMLPILLFVILGIWLLFVFWLTRKENEIKKINRILWKVVFFVGYSYFALIIIVIFDHVSGGLL